MNDVAPEHGGATRFYHDRDQRKDAALGAPVLSVVPSAGLGVVFRQPPGACLLHDGEELRAG
eukprot:4751072-Prymnesium_polylepis.1